MAAWTEAKTATFLMSDIEGSTRLWQDQRDAMAVAITQSAPTTVDVG